MIIDHGIDAYRILISELVFSIFSELVIVFGQRGGELRDVVDDALQQLRLGDVLRRTDRRHEGLEEAEAGVHLLSLRRGSGRRLGDAPGGRLGDAVESGEGGAEVGGGGIGGDHGGGFHFDGWGVELLEKEEKCLSLLIKSVFVSRWRRAFARKVSPSCGGW